jgi:hypothetical protein
LPFAGQLIPGSIGQHRIRFRPEAADLVVTTDIALKVKLAFITLLDMRHDSEERWRDGRLAVRCAAAPPMATRLTTSTR